jgi:hypothetical protein
MLTAYPVREFFLALAFHHRDNVGMLIPIRSDAVVRFPSHMAITVKARAFLLSEYLLELRNSPWSPSGFSAAICGFPNRSVWIYGCAPRSCGQAGPSSPDIFERDLPNVDFQRSRGIRISGLASSGRVNASRMWTRIAIAERGFVNATRHRASTACDTAADLAS